MAALTADRNRQARGTGKVYLFPMAAVKIYKGSIVMANASGFATPGTDTAALRVVGIATETIDNAAGAAGDKFIHVDADREFLFVATSITQAMLGTLMVCVDDDNVDDAAGATNDIPVGRLTEFVTTTSGWVLVPGLEN